MARLRDGVVQLERQTGTPLTTLTLLSIVTMGDIAEPEAITDLCGKDYSTLPLTRPSLKRPLGSGDDLASLRDFAETFSAGLAPRLYGYCNPSVFFRAQLAHRSFAALLAFSLRGSGRRLLGRTWISLSASA
jgi:hypothetical protein